MSSEKFRNKLSLLVSSESRQGHLPTTLQGLAVFFVRMGKNKRRVVKAVSLTKILVFLVLKTYLP